MTETMQTQQDLLGKVVMISAGGTGGHVYPGIALANKLQARGAKIHWLGTEQGIEARLLPNQPIEFHPIEVKGLRGKGLRRLLTAPFTIIKAIGQARAVFRQTRPDVYIGFGGFVTGPSGMAAKLSRVPIIVHEQNAAMGLTNRLMRKIANTLLLAFPIDGVQASVVGNPIRQQISDIAPPCQRIGQADKLRILVFGGSQGARAINEVLPEAIKILGDKVRVVQQTGEADFNKVVQAYQANAIEAEVRPYIDDMANAYANTDLVIARAGALSVSEIASAGVAAIFIPLPHAVDDHQRLNADFLVKNGAAKMLLQSDLTATRLAAEVSQLMDADILLNMANKARNLSHKNALLSIEQEVCKWL